MLAIKNVTVVMPDHMIPDGVIITDGGKIVDVGRKLSIPPGAKVIDGEGNYAGPGLVDIHTGTGAYCRKGRRKLCCPLCKPS